MSTNDYGVLKKKNNKDNNNDNELLYFANEAEVS